MARFLTRVELHNATWPDDYNKLHLAMQKEGFSRHITSNQGIVYDLPTAEYWCEKDISCQEVRLLAQKAANTIGKKYAVITAECGAISWEGLNITQKTAIR